MGVTPIKEELYHFIEEGDAKLIELLHAVATEYAATENDLSNDQIEELKSRMIRYEDSQMCFSSWDDVKGRIRSRARLQTNI
jgi:hypothetical protein